MTATSTASRSTRTAWPAAHPEPRAGRSVIGWAVVGVVALGVEAWSLANWVLAGEATPVPRGSTPVPTWMLGSIRTIEVATGAGFAAVLWWFLLRPWRREGRISRDGWLLLVFMTMAWQDSLLNFFQPWFAYNGVLLNLGSWNAHVPGWYSPNGEMVANPLLFYCGYGSVIFFGVVLGNAFVRGVAARRPRLGPAGLVAVTFGFYAVFCTFELIFLLSGLYAYPGAIRSLTLFAGRHYQYPLYEWLALTSVMTAWACMRYFRNDRNETLAERGIGSLRVSERRRNGIRFLALAGMGNLIFGLCYNLPLSLSGLYADPWPADVTTRSYFMTGICGPGTDYACPGPGVPVARPGSDHLRPDGTLARRPRG